MKKYSCYLILCLITIFLTFMEYTDIKELPNSCGKYFIDGLGKYHVYKLIKENKIISNKYLGSIFYIKECLGPTIE